MQYRIHQPVILAQRRHLKRWIIGGLSVVLAVITMVKILTSPALGHNVAVDRKALTVHPTSAAPAPASTLDNKYFTLHLPSGYKLNSTQTTPTDSLVSATIVKGSAFETSVMSVSVVKSPDGVWQNLSSYRARQQTPNNYSISSFSQSGETLSLVTRRDGEAGEVVAFWPHGAYVATVAVSSSTQGTGDTETNQANLRTLLTNWQWH